MKNKALRIRLIQSGLLSFSFHGLLFVDAEHFWRLSTRADGLYFLMPVIIAPAFSPCMGRSPATCGKSSASSETRARDGK